MDRWLNRRVSRHLTPLLVVRLCGLALSTKDYHVVVLACAVVGHLDWFLWGAAVGSHVFWMTVVVMMWRAGRSDVGGRRGQRRE